MPPISDSEIHDIVQRVMQRMGKSNSSPSKAIPTPSTSPSVPTMKSGATVAIGGDHGGFDMKAMLKTYLAELGFGVVDCGSYDKNPVDYPDIALAVAKMVSEGTAWRGIIIDGAGIGSCMAANKVPGVRAALCYDYATAVNSREHNDANVLTLGAGLIGNNLAKQIVKTWLNTDFGGGRHQPRIDKIIGIEKLYMKVGK
jgi:ribose 5-phosphate isomerase B